MDFHSDFSIPDKVLTASEKIQLADLLGSVTFRHWIVSAMCNAVQSAPLTGLQADDDDQFLQFRINQMINAIPYETRRECFNETGRLIRERKMAFASRPSRD